MNMINEENGIDPVLFREAQEMMKKRFGEMVMYYLEDLATYLNEIRAGLETTDAKKIYPAAHTIKSSSRQLGVVKVSDFAKEVEFIGRAIAEGGESGANTFGAIVTCAEQLEDAAKTAETVLKEFLSGLPQ